MLASTANKTDTTISLPVAEIMTKPAISKKVNSTSCIVMYAGISWWKNGKLNSKISKVVRKTSILFLER